MDDERMDRFELRELWLREGGKPDDMVTSEGKPKSCPECGSKKVADILYGYPAYDEQMQKEMDEGRLVLGGCMVSGLDPRWQCMNCETKIYRERELEKFREEMGLSTDSDEPGAARR